MIKSILLLLFFLMGGIAIAQPPSSDMALLSIVSDTIRGKVSESSVVINYSMKNLSDTNFIFYSLTNDLLHSVTKNIARYCDTERTGANVAFILFDKNEKWKSGSYPIVSNSGNPMTPQRADSLMRLAARQTLEKKVVINAKEHYDLQQTLDLRPYNFSKGIYYIQLIYFSGKQIRWFADVEQQLNDEIAHNAKVFQGCVVSGRKVIVLD